MTDDSPEPAKRRKGPQEAPERRARGFVRAAELTTAALKSTGARRGFAEARLLTEWRAVVGEALDAVCRPLKVSYGGRAIGLGATLVVTAEGARAPEVEMQKTRIIDRVNAFYGYRAVSRLVIDQSRSGAVASRSFGMAEAASPFEGPPPDAAEPARAGPISDIKDDRLALALARLGANISARAARPKPDGDASNEKDI